MDRITRLRMHMLMRRVPTKAAIRAGARASRFCWLALPKWGRTGLGTAMASRSPMAASCQQATAAGMSLTCVLSEPRRCGHPVLVLADRPVTVAEVAAQRTRLPEVAPRVSLLALELRLARLCGLGLRCRRPPGIQLLCPCRRLRNRPAGWRRRLRRPLPLKLARRRLSSGWQRWLARGCLCHRRAHLPPSHHCLPRRRCSSVRPPRREVSCLRRLTWRRPLPLWLRQEADSIVWPQ